MRTFSKGYCSPASASSSSVLDGTAGLRSGVIMSAGPFGVRESAPRCAGVRGAFAVELALGNLRDEPGCGKWHGESGIFWESNRTSQSIHATNAKGCTAHW